MKVTKHLSITGKVQGVWYRESMRQAAEGLGITGWVRNRGDGSVEAVAHGTAEAVQALIDWAWDGPPAAEVAHIEVREDEGTFTAFEKRPSA